MKINKNTIISLFAVGLFFLNYNSVKALTANAVDRIAFRIKNTTPIINEDSNTINMDWLKELRFNAILQRYGTGADIDLSTEQGIADARHAIWKSDTVQNAYKAYEKTLSGDKQGAKDRFMGSIERGLQELSKDTTVTPTSRPLPQTPSTQPVMSESPTSEGRVTDKSTLPYYMRTVRGPSVSTPSEGSLTDKSTLPYYMRTVRGSSVSTPSEGSLTDKSTLPYYMRTVRGPSVSTPSKEESREEKFRTAREEAAKRRAARSNQR